MAEITITLPGAAPELYLRAVNWWREATRYVVAVGSLGAATERSRGADPITDLLDFDAPESVEALARQAIAEGRLEIAPRFRLDAVFAAQAMERGLERWRWLQSMAPHGAPVVDREVEALHEASIAVTQEMLRPHLN